MRIQRAHVTASLFSFLASALRLGANGDPASLDEILRAELEKSAVPSLAAAVVTKDQIQATAAAGVRKQGDPTPVTPADKYHLGSCTKTMTATLAAILVEDGLLDWNSTVFDILGQSIPDIHSDFRSVTLEQLLAHVGGFATNPPPSVWQQAWSDQGRIPETEQRLAFCAALLKDKPAYSPGSKTEYSNQGYAVAGLMMETVAGRSWETLLAEKVFQPLGMESAGFRAPGTPNELDQPWGHRQGAPVPPGQLADNPDAIGPAGTVHASIEDWARFAQYHLRRQPAPLLKNEATLDKLHSTLPNSKAHSVGGWLAHDIPRFGGHCLQMVGSNTMWFSLMWILPEPGIAIVVTTNSGDPKAFKTLDRVAGKLIQQHAP